jgi:iron complex outermembrane receptor protein
MMIDRKGPRALAAWLPRCAFAAVAILAASAVHAQAGAPLPVKIYAQELVDRTVAQHPDLRAVMLHVTPHRQACRQR